MLRPRPALAIALFAVRSTVNVTLFMALLGFFADLSVAGSLGILLLFAMSMPALAMIPILVATMIAAIRLAEGRPSWRTMAMRVVAAGMVVDLFFLGGSNSWWLGVVALSVDAALWLLLAGLDDSGVCGERGSANLSEKPTAAGSPDARPVSLRL